MAVALDRSETNLSFDENVTSINNDDDLVKFTTHEINKILQFDDDEIGGEIVMDLLENGRNALTKYEDDIIPRVYSEEMNGNDTKLMSSLKRYFRQKWEIQYSSSDPWFISFLKQYENGENYDVYESILLRTAQYGNKYMKDCPLLSTVSQFLFECIDDECLEETNNVFDDLWLTITNDGLKSIEKYSDYIVKKVLHEQLKKHSVLFEALRKYYSPNVLLSLTRSSIAQRQSLYDLALDDVVEHGWLSDMKSIAGDITPRRHRMLLENLRSFYKTQNSAPNQDTDGPVVPSPNINVSTLPKPNTTNNGQQETSAEVNQSKINQLQSTVSTQNVAVTEEIPSDTETAAEVLDHVTDENIEKKDTQKDENEQGNAELDDSHDSTNGLSNTDNTQVRSNDAIFISGLPQNMSKERLFDKLKNIFSTCGDIKIYEETKGLDIWLSPGSKNKFQLNGTAMVRFEKVESAMAAIEKYNKKQVPALNDAQIGVRFYRMNSKGMETSSRSTRPKDTPQPKPDNPVNPTEATDSAGKLGVVDTLEKLMFVKDTIYIAGLPTNIREELLFDTLWDEFSNVGPIKRDREKKPCIRLHKMKDSKFQLNGAATVTFENEELVTKAIRKYNGKQVPSLNDSRLYVQRSKKKTRKLTQPPIQHPPPENQPNGRVSIFWDIENVAIPAGNSAFDIIKKLRKQLIEDRNLAEGAFKTYYRSINNIPRQHRADLYHANVSVQHIESNKPGAVDKQIQKDLQQFIKQHTTPSTVVLITGDNDFSDDLSELRYQNRHYTILIHNPQAIGQLLQTANESIPWKEFVEKKCPDEPRQQRTAKTSIPSLKCRPLMQLNVDEPTMKTNDNVLKSSADVADRSKREKPHHHTNKHDVLKNEVSSKGRRRRNENEPDAQSPKPLMSLISDSSNAIAIDGDSVVASTNKADKPKKKNKPSEIVCTIPCTMCNKKFINDDALIQHERDKHKVGTLVEVSSLVPITGSNDHSQSSDHDNPKHIDLIAFTDDDNDDGDPPHLNLLTDSEDDSNTSESSSESNNNIWSETNPPDNEKPTESDVLKHTEEDD